MNQEIVPASGIDYGNVDEVCGYQFLLYKIFERAGGFELPAAANAAVYEVRRQGRLWLREVRSLMAGILSAPAGASPAAPRMTLAAIPDLSAAYDFLYRICHGGPCPDYLREVRLKAAERRLGGDKSISETDVALLLLTEADRDIRSLDRRYSDYAFSVLGDWIDELMRCGRFTGIPLAEAYKRLACLLRRDLFVYFNSREQPEIKARWVREYALSGHQLDRLGTKELWSYMAFANAASYYPCGSVSEDPIARYMHLLSRLASRPDIHPFYREGIAIDLVQCRTA